MDSILQSNSLRAMSKHFLLPHNFKWQQPRKLFNPLGCVCETHNHQQEICISNQKPSYILMEPYIQQYCQRHIQECISWNINRNKIGKSTTRMMLPSLLGVQDNNIRPKWYEETTGLFWMSRGWWPARTISTHL